jgi:hypothetical protein
MLRAEATKRAAWLSAMDQFYENLAETQREFDETLTFKTETREKELAFAREQFGAEMELQRDRFELEEEKFEFEREQIKREQDPFGRRLLGELDVENLLEKKFELETGLLEKRFELESGLQEELFGYEAAPEAGPVRAEAPGAVKVESGRVPSGLSEYFSRPENIYATEELAGRKGL